MINVTLGNFSISEFTCRCGCGGKGMDQDVLIALQTLRTSFRGPLTINSGYRCPPYNASAAVQGHPNSRHMQGLAADIDLDGIDSEAIRRLIELVLGGPWTGVGLYPGFIHVDMGHPSRVVWFK